MLDGTRSIGEERERSVARLLAAAHDAIAAVPICWVATAVGDGRNANVRAVRDCTADLGRAATADPWTRWFLARRDSRKTAELRRTGRATLAYQHASGDAYVTLCGRAELLDDRSLVSAGLRAVDDPDGALAAKLVAVRVAADRVELHVRGVTAGPWGHGRTLLEWDGNGAWRLVP